MQSSSVYEVCTVDRPVCKDKPTSLFIDRYPSSSWPWFFALLKWKSKSIQGICLQLQKFLCMSQSVLSSQSLKASKNSFQHLLESLVTENTELLLFFHCSYSLAKMMHSNYIAAQMNYFCPLIFTWYMLPVQAQEIIWRTWNIKGKGYWNPNPPRLPSHIPNILDTFLHTMIFPTLLL